MKTPIFDFLKRYSEDDISRMHMPGHKGRGILGCELYDITEIDGADVLYSPGGIIAESENCATELFGTAHTFYSTEGSTLAIKAMLHIAMTTRKFDTPPVVLAARNVHKAFVYAAALLDLSVEWINAKTPHICKQCITPKAVEDALAGMERPPFAVYITSPDYLGGVADISVIAEVCDRWGVPLLVDNAHGAYLASLSPSRHPIALGAAMCADSAHKTLPVLTGGAYLHVSKKCPELLSGARESLSLFASTSPSYLTLASLDICNRYMAEGYKETLAGLVLKLDGLRAEFAANGTPALDSEPLKLIFRPGSFGVSSSKFSDIIRSWHIEPEFVDNEYVVLMLTPENTDEDLRRLRSAVLSVRPTERREEQPPSPVNIPQRKMTIRQAIFSRAETVATEDSVGRIAAAPAVSCPPAIPIVVSGEVIDERSVLAFKRYGIATVSVVKE